MRLLLVRHALLLSGLVLVIAVNGRVEGSARADEGGGHHPRWETSRIRGTPEPPAAFELVPALGGLHFREPTCIAEAPGTNCIYVTEKGGDIYSVSKAASAPQAELVGRLSELLEGSEDPEGLALFDLAFHPNFATNRQLVVSYVYPGEGTRVSRFQLSDSDPPRLKLDSQRVIIRWPAGGHNGGCLHFGPDGYLYISTGDGSGPHPPDARDAGQDLSNLWATILRIDVDRPSPGKAYSIPLDNPFLDTPRARPEIWAFGFRNPFKMAMDSQTGTLWVGDNGWETWEMIHRVQRGGNHGWPLREGPAVLRTDVEPGPGPIIPPARAHRHPEFNSIIGGIVYRGSQHAELQGSLIYGDYFHGRIWALRHDAGQSVSAQLLDTDLRIVCFAEGSRGEIYVLDYDVTGGIYQLRESQRQDLSAQFPRKLSQTGVFASLEELQPASGVVPYHLRAEPWMDGATASRVVGLPGTSRARLVERPQGMGWEMPEGAVLAKTLSLDSAGDDGPLHVETQILHREVGTWRVYSYAWNESQTDAELVDTTGADHSFPAEVGNSASPSGRNWRIGGRAECRLCHHTATGPVLGFVPSQLDRTIEVDGKPVNQLDHLAAIGVLDRSPQRRDDRPTIVDPHDATARLDDRVRSYLHVNCSMCHQARGDSTVSIHLLRDLSLAETRVFKSPAVGSFHIPDAQVVARGEPYRSVLLYRISKLGYARMPLVGSRVVDPLAVTLVRDWIASLSDAALKTTLARHEDRGALDLLLAPQGAAEEEREAAIAQLLGSTEGAMALSYRMHRGQLSNADVQRVVEQSLKLTSTDIRGLLEDFVPESRRSARLGPNPRIETVLSKQGDAARGDVIFHSDAARCRVCHVGEKPQDLVGPDLRKLAVGKKYPRSELLQHILDPSAKVEPEHAQYTLVTKGGRTHRGLLVESNDQQVVIKTATKELIRVRAAEVDALSKDSTSLMPTLLLRDFTPQEAADLLEFLTSLK